MADQENMHVAMPPKTPTQASVLLGAALLLPGCFAPDLMPTGSGETEAESSSGGPTTEPMTNTTATGSTGSPTTGPPMTTGVGPQTTGDFTTGDPTAGDSTTDATTSGGETTSSGGEEQTDSSSTGEPVVCGDGGVCIPAVPEGWNGPVATRTLDIDDDIPPCGGDAYTELQVSDAFGGLGADPFGCDCECVADSIACEGDASFQLTNSATLPCFSPNYSFDYDLISGSPQGVAVSMSPNRGVALDGPTAPELGGSCTPQPTTSPTPAGFDTRTIACGTFDASPDGCDEGLCVPQPSAPYDAPVCIWAEGELDCPTGFGDRTVYDGDYSDTRSCSTCTCNAPEGSCSTERLYIEAWCDRDGFICVGPTCGPNGTYPCPNRARYPVVDTCGVITMEDFCPQFPASALQECIDDNTLVQLREFEYSAGLATGSSCPPSGGSPTGEVAGTEPTTFCCTG